MGDFDHDDDDNEDPQMGPPVYEEISTVTTEGVEKATHL